MGLFARMLWRELLGAMMLTLLALSALVLLGGAAVTALLRGMNPREIVELLPYLLAPSFPFTVPMSLLFACAITFSRMSSQAEIIALKAAGISVFAVLWPALALAAISAGCCVLLADRVIPHCHRQLAEAALRDPVSKFYTFLQLRGWIASSDLPYEVYVRNVRGGRLLQPIFKLKSDGEKPALVIQAEEARLEAPPGHEAAPTFLYLHLKNGVVSNSRGDSIHFTERRETLPLPPTPSPIEEKAAALTFSQCRALRTKFQKQLRELDFALACAGGPGSMVGHPALFAHETHWNRKLAKRIARKEREADAEPPLRVAQALVALPFVLLVCPVSILLHRRDFLQAFFVCFLPIVTLYYPAMALVYNVYKEGGHVSLVALWAPSSVMSIVALPLLWRVIRY